MTSLSFSQFIQIGVLISSVFFSSQGYCDDLVIFEIPHSYFGNAPDFITPDKKSIIIDKPNEYFRPIVFDPFNPKTDVKKQLEVWSLETGKKLFDLEPYWMLRCCDDSSRQVDTVTQVRFTPDDSRMLAFITYTNRSHGGLIEEDYGVLAGWNLKNKEILFSKSHIRSGSSFQLTQDGTGILVTRWSPGNGWVYFQLLSTESGEVMKEIRIKWADERLGPPRGTESVGIIPDSAGFGPTEDSIIVREQHGRRTFLLRFPLGTPQ